MDGEKKIGIPGLAILCVGLGLLVFVFYLAYQFLQSPTMLSLGEKGMDSNQFFTNMLYVVISLAALAIMGSVAGRIAFKGIGLYRSRKS